MFVVIPVVFASPMVVSRACLHGGYRNPSSEPVTAVQGQTYPVLLLHLEVVFLLEIVLVSTHCQNSKFTLSDNAQICIFSCAVGSNYRESSC